MTVPYYVPPEQMMKDRADFARSGIARGRAVVVSTYADGVCFVAQNPSGTLHKVSEIYDRIAFAAVGRYFEFEALRRAGIANADVRGYTYDRDDVRARSLVDYYAQVLGSSFASMDKPLEVELALAELGASPADDRIYTISFDGSVGDERTFVVMGGQADAIEESLRSDWQPRRPLSDAVAAASRALGASEADVALEVAVLDRTRPGRRTFARVATALVDDWRS